MSIDLRKENGYKLKQQEMMSTESNSWSISKQQFKYTGSVSKQAGKKQPKTHQLPTPIPIPKHHEETQITFMMWNKLQALGGRCAMHRQCL